MQNGTIWNKNELAEGKTDLPNYLNKNMPEGIDLTRGVWGVSPHGGFGGFPPPQRTPVGG
jgi:hypothetical protein